MKLVVASKKAIDFACRNYHYSRSVPVASFGFSIFNNNDEWCGVILFGRGASLYLGKQYGLANGEFCELTRVALNGKQEFTSKALSLSLKLLPKYLPLVRLVISFADQGQNHLGIIYQATNWFFTGVAKSDKRYFINNRWMHPRQVGSINGSRAKNNLPIGTLISDGSPKYRYLYPLDRSLISLCKSLSKLYPKNAVKAQEKCAEPSSSEVAVVQTSPL